MFNINRDSLFNINLCTNQRILKRMKKTAVEWLIEQLSEIHENSAIAQQAKEMEKEQIIKAASISYEDMFGIDGVKYGEEYYNETFKPE
jgi:hypothetical protein